jgi:hypothetical protein
MSAAHSDRNLLFGVLALQMDFLGRDALLAAMHAWLLNKTKPLGTILVEQHALTLEHRALLESLVQAHLRLHGDDPEKSLEAVAVPTPLRDELRSLADADVQASLAHLPTPSRPAEPGPLPTTVAEVKKIAGLRYQIVRPHDKGGIGEVFVALDQELNRQVALKEIQEQHASDPRNLGRFVREAEITGGLEHPGIVPVYGLGQYADGRPFYAMRFIQGETLKHAIDKFHAGELAVTLRGLLTRFVAECNTIAYAHSRSVIHRDLKPSNIMLGKYGETLVVDWGMAKAGGGEPARSTGDGLPEPTLVPSLADGIRERHTKDARAHPLRERLDGPARARRVTPFKDDDHSGTRVYHPLLQQAQFGLQLPQLLLVLLALHLALGGFLMMLGHRFLPTSGLHAGGPRGGVFSIHMTGRRIPDSGRILLDGTVAGELPRTGHIQDGLAGPGVRIGV